MPFSDADLEDLKARLIARAWLDEDFRALLLADADAAARTECDVLPEGLHLRVVTSASDLPPGDEAGVFVLPPNPFARKPNPLFGGLLGKKS